MVEESVSIVNYIRDKRDTKTNNENVWIHLYNWIQEYSRGTIEHKIIAMQKQKIHHIRVS